MYTDQERLVHLTFAIELVLKNPSLMDPSHGGL
jgi:hypothetical protein